MYIIAICLKFSKRLYMLIQPCGAAWSYPGPGPGSQLHSKERGTVTEDTVSDANHPQTTPAPEA